MLLRHQTLPELARTKWESWNERSEREALLLLGRGVVPTFFGWTGGFAQVDS